VTWYRPILVDPERLHEERMRRNEERMAEAARMIEVLQEQVGVIRAHLGLPSEEPLRRTG
jgi:hypothetical protein